jgi:hypothetical protein
VRDLAPSSAGSLSGILKEGARDRFEPKTLGRWHSSILPSPTFELRQIDSMILSTPNRSLPRLRAEKPSVQPAIVSSPAPLSHEADEFIAGMPVILPPFRPVDGAQSKPDRQVRMKKNINKNSLEQTLYSL